MTQQHPITPPPELVQQWIREKDGLELVVTRAAQWGADQELQACCEWLQEGFGEVGDFPQKLRAARRPKPPSLKERALEAMHRNWNPHNNDDFATIARALEQLPE